MTGLSGPFSVSNGPWLSSALEVVADVLSLATAAGIPVEITLLLGFSQGTRLALEYAAQSQTLWRCDLAQRRAHREW